MLPHYHPAVGKPRRLTSIHIQSILLHSKFNHQQCHGIFFFLIIITKCVSLMFSKKKTHLIIDGCTR
ncbi:hypothetical protein BHE74_00009720 [Ensete ventricosum]|nr:hypothetical protein GW17_00051815 [Ensete ventricosum]RWW81849.1 hypothetical protein BHE74_00009720 [Ensete ventricosum]